MPKQEAGKRKSRNETEWSSWQDLDIRPLRSVTAATRLVLRLRKKNPNIQFRIHKMIGPRGGVTYEIDGRERL